MCGIVGIRRFDDGSIDVGTLTQMRDAVAHRGPDGRGLFIKPGVGFGHVRLAILDLSDRAAQPMTSRCGRFTVTYNGEIYNYRELARQVNRRGAHGRSTGDTQVLVEMISQQGLDATLPMLEGFFGLAVWDAQDRTLTLARDRRGIKPLYYKRTSHDELHFASEMKSLIGSGAEPDATALNAAILGQTTTWGPRTLYQGVKRVQPGEVITINGAGTTSRRFFEPLDEIDVSMAADLREESDDAIIDRFEDAFQRSIDHRLISDAPVACLASGGVDSNLIAAMASRRIDDLTLYHAAVQHDCELPHARALARHLRLPLQVVEVTDADMIDELVAVTYHNDEPIIYHTNSVPFHQVCQRVSADGFKVVLTGEGSDEFFMGYPGAGLARWVKRYRSLLGLGQRLAHAAVPRAARVLMPRRADNRAELLRRMMFRADDELAIQDADRSLQHVCCRRERRELSMSLCLTQQHLSSLLHRNDRLAMAWGVESRFPFLGHDVTRLAVNLPGRAKIRSTWSLHDARHPFVMDKWCVRRLADRYLPRSLSVRPKKGFPVTLLNRLIIDPSFFRDGYLADYFGLSAKALEHLVSTSPRNWIGHLLLTEIWARLFLRHEAVASVQHDVRRGVRTINRANETRSTSARLRVRPAAAA